MDSFLKYFKLKIVIIVAFILNLFFLTCNAQSMNITSVTFDNSSSFLTINSYDNFDYTPENKPQITILEDENQAYFDLQPAVLTGNAKDYVIESDTINELHLFQLSNAPSIVRVSFKYNPNFNPQDISIQKLNNTLFVKFKKTVLSNYYFQEIYKESGTQSLLEKINIWQKMPKAKNTLGEINSAFTNNLDNPEDNILSAKDIILKSKYYIDSVTIKGTIPILYGIGSYTLIKPIYLTSPYRAVFDIKNAQVNPVLRNKEIPIGSDTLKIGQFDNNTARIVINSQKNENYVPVIYGDTQKLAIINNKTSPLNLYNSVIDMTAVSAENGDKKNYSMKLTFSNPLIFGINRQNKKLELLLFNINNYYSGAIKSELRGTPFENIETTDIKSGGVKLSLPLNDGDEPDVYLGANGKTLRIKLHTKTEYTPKQEDISPEIVVPNTINRKNGMHYVVIDAGHGGTDYGALRGNINEKNITLDISKRVEKLLEKKGYIVAMTRTNDTYVSLQDRVEFSEVFNPDIFVSIHVNSSNSESPSGLETHYYKDNSLTLAKCVHAAMLNNINSKDRGLFKSKFYVINHTTAPAILVEIGFISNPNERAQLVTESRKNATAKAIVEGIDEYFKK